MSKRMMILLAVLWSAAAACPAADIIPADRKTTWNPGLNSVGGVPNRTVVFATISAATYGNGAADATAGIQAKLDACPAGQVVLLSAGAFTINNDILYIKKSVTLRGAGAQQTTLQRTNGARPGTYIPGVSKPIIIVGPSRWSSGGTAYNLAANAVKGTFSVQLASAPAAGLAPGQIVKVDELSGAAWRADPQGRGQIWASADFRVVYQRHNPALGTDDPWPSAAGWFCRPDRPTSDIKEVQSYDAATRTVTFTSPFHIDYRVANTAQLFVYAAQDTHVKYAGVEDLKLQGGDDGQLRFEFAAYCWASRVENTAWLGEGFAINNAFRVEVRDSHVHTPVWFEPGGGSYNISLANGSSEVLIENNISMNANKVMVSRCSGAGCVVGYNYMDDGRIGSNPGWVEIGLNASHMVGCHHVLFEGNYCFNADSDHTHGNSIMNTYFRNHLSGQRRNFTDNGPRRCVGLMAYSYWFAFAGNVLGRSGQMSGWVYESQSFNAKAVWMLGWDGFSPYPADPNIVALTYRHGNFDYLTNTQQWDPAVSNHTLPNSLYLTQKPAFFGNDTWPWVQPEGATKLYALPARKRFDGVPPNNPPTIATAASASPNPVAATSTALSVLGTDDGGEANLKYTWAVTGTPPAPVGFSANASNAAKNTTATFSKVGSYNFQVTVNDAAGLTITSAVSVTVNPTLTAITVSPASANVVTGGTQQFSAAAKDQFGAAMSAAVTWAVSGGGTINSAGLFTAGGVVSGPFTVTATSGAKSGTASVSVIAPTNSPPTIATAASASPNPVAATSTALSVFGADNGGEPNLKYTWAATGTPPALVSFSANASNAAKNTTATFLKAGSYSFLVAVADAAGLSVTSSVNVTVNQTLTSITVAPANADVVTGATQQFTASAKDQFGAAMSAAVTWAVSGGGTINSAGLFTAGSVVSGPFIVTAISGVKSGTASVKVIAPPNHAPVISSAATAAPNPANVGQPVAFSAAATDGDGDPLAYAWNFGDQLAASGTSVSHTYSAAGTYTAVVTVSDNRGGGASSGVTVTVNTETGGGSVVKINFQPRNAPVPSGYLADSGAAFGDRGNGFSYGWNIDNGSSARDRNSSASPDQRYDTLQHLQKPQNPNAFWELAVPNGSYRVRIVSGDPSYIDSVYKLNVEGVLTVNGRPTASVRWFEGVSTVVVSDGRLTISNATGGTNNKICFVEISNATAATVAAAAADLGNVFKAMTVSAVQASMNFMKSQRDTLKISAAIADLPRDFALDGAPISLDFGGAIASFVLDARGRGRNDLGACGMKYSASTQAWIVKISQKGGAWAEAWSDAGLDKSQKQLALPMPVTLTIGTQTFGGEAAVQYQNKTGKAGLLKKVR